MAGWFFRHFSMVESLLREEEGKYISFFRRCYYFLFRIILLNVIPFYYRIANTIQPPFHLTYICHEENTSYFAIFNTKQITSPKTYTPQNPKCVSHSPPPSVDTTPRRSTSLLVLCRDTRTTAGIIIMVTTTVDTTAIALLIPLSPGRLQGP